jgi:hypothetical protein
LIVRGREANAKLGRITIATVASPSALIGTRIGSNPISGNPYVFAWDGTSWVFQAKLVANDGASLEGAGAISGNTAIAAGSGGAYVFTRSGTVWTTQPVKLIADQGDALTGPAALDGDTAIVAANGDNPYNGAAYIFVHSGPAWPKFQRLAEAFPANYFGTSVALRGNTAVVGAPAPITNFAAFDHGFTYVFALANGVWSQTAALTVDGGWEYLGSGDYLDTNFGSSVALSGNTVLVGASHYDTSDGHDAGNATVFVPNETQTAWIPQQTLTAVDIVNEGDGFGASIALDGDTALVGAPRTGTSSSDIGSFGAPGSAYVFVHHANIWQRQAKLTAAGYGLGISVALSGDTAVVGAFPPDRTVFPVVGRAFVFVRNGTSWSPETELISGSGGSFRDFGSSVAVSGNVALVGWPNSVTNFPASGTVRVFSRNGSTWTEQPLLTASDGTDNDGFGSAIALSTDGNTAVVGAPSAAALSGKAYVFSRNQTGWAEYQLPVSGAAPQQAFGSSVAIDGATIIVGAPGGTPISINGSAYVYLRSDAVWNQQAKLTAADGAAGDKFGSSVALRGNITLVGAEGDDVSSLVDAGSAYFFQRASVAWTQQTKITAGTDASSSAAFGSSAALNADTAFIGAEFDDTVGTDAGNVFVALLGELPQITLQPKPLAVIPGQSVMFSAKATGYAPLHYQWRKDSVDITDISGANGTVAASGTINLTIPSAQLTDHGSYDVVVSNIGGVVTSAAADLIVNDLSQFDQHFPSAPFSAQGVIQITLIPSSVTGAKWRFVGEQEWRPSGISVVGLTTGSREIEFRPVPGWIQPARELVNVNSGGSATLLTREYFQTSGGVVGGLTVTLKPDSAVTAGAQWRLLGDTTWNNSGVTKSNLFPGVYLVEFKRVTGLTTPTPLSVSVPAGQTAAAVATYFLIDARPPGAQIPAVLPFATVTANPSIFPYAYVGQLRSDLGSATGFVVKARVVATAAHVVFDDYKLTAAPALPPTATAAQLLPFTATGLQWLFQRDKGTYEPVPQIPRGFYVLSGYASQRSKDPIAGQSTTASRNQDVAALYFLENAGRGGFGGFLASDATLNNENEFLTSSQPKILVGYPIDRISVVNQGRMHATPPLDVHFTRVVGTDAYNNKPYRLYTTSDITSYGGNSGGPLCVLENGKYYPAGIYLGGSAETVIRAIDKKVVDLFDRAKVSGDGGTNNQNGGTIQVSSPIQGSNLTTASLKVIIKPDGAVNGGARWKLSPTGTEFKSEFTRDFITAPSSPTLYLKPVTGFSAPLATPIPLYKGFVTTVTATYGQSTQPAVTNNTASLLRTDFNKDGSPDFVLYNGARATVWYLHSNTYSSTGVGVTLLADFKLVSVNDFSNPKDNRPDLVLFNSSTKKTSIRYGPTFSSSVPGPMINPGWTLLTTADFNGDGKSDFVLVNGAGQIWYWFLNGVVSAGSDLGPIIPSGWTLSTVGDCDGDHNPDFVLTSTSGRTKVWNLDQHGKVILRETAGPNLPSGWQIAGSDDYNGDSRRDWVILQPASTPPTARKTEVWFMNNATRIDRVPGPTLPAGYSLFGK